MRPTAAGERLLLVDDEKAVAGVIREYLNELKYEVIVATSATEALKIFGERPSAFDLVLTDWQMPKMSGLRLAKEIAAIRAGVPVLLMTGFTEDQVMDVPPEVRGIIAKPIPLVELAELIRSTLHPHVEANIRSNTVRSA